MIKYDFVEVTQAILINVRINRLQLYLISFLVNLSFEFGLIMGIQDFLEVKRVILMFEPTQTRPNYTFGQLSI